LPWVDGSSPSEGLLLGTWLFGRSSCAKAGWGTVRRETGDRPPSLPHDGGVFVPSLPAYQMAETQTVGTSRLTSRKAAPGSTALRKMRATIARRCSRGASGNPVSARASESIRTLRASSHASHGLGTEMSVGPRRRIALGCVSCGSARSSSESTRRPSAVSPKRSRSAKIRVWDQGVAPM
jgi:hypothetical protein